MNRRKFLNTTALSTVGMATLSAFEKQLAAQKNIKISLTPWSLIRTSYGDKDPLNVDLFDFVKKK